MKNLEALDFICTNSENRLLHLVFDSFNSGNITLRLGCLDLPRRKSPQTEEEMQIRKKTMQFSMFKHLLKS